MAGFIGVKDPANHTDGLGRGDIPWFIKDDPTVNRIAAPP
jgi:hypothetical protein